MNRLLLAASVATLSALLLLRFTSITEEVIAVAGLIGGVLIWLFPRVRSFHGQTWFQSQVVTAALSATFCIGGAFLVYPYIVSEQPNLNTNRLVTYGSFEGTDEGWSRVLVQEFGPDDEVKSEFHGTPSFPGSITVNPTKDNALIGHSSLKVTTSVSLKGEYKGFIFRKGAISAYGMTVYVLTPKLDDVSISYIQICVPSHEWACSNGTKLIPGEWTPITLDLAQTDKKGVALYNQKLAELAIQWKFSTSSQTSFELFFDTLEIYHSGS